MEEYFHVPYSKVFMKSIEIYKNSVFEEYYNKISLKLPKYSI
jgi:hypothetical protein